MRSDSGVEGAAAGADATLADLAAMLEHLAGIADAGTAPGSTGDAVLVDRIALLERVKAAAAAAQHTAIVAFGRAQVAQQLRTPGFDPEKVGQGIGDQVALARKLSPTIGPRRVETARTLQPDLPATRGLLRAGTISEYVAEIVVNRTAHLSPEQRRALDPRIAAAGIDQANPRRAGAIVTKLAVQADPAAYCARAAYARTERRVCLRPAPDSMTWLSVLLPLEQGVACLAALRTHADAAVAGGEERTRNQVMADTAVERLTGQATATDINVEVGVVIGVDALLDPDTTEAAEIVGHGPVPGRLAREILAGTNGRRWWRRLFARPAGGPVIGGDPRRRYFDGTLATIIRIRDGDRCRDPFCDAPARHIDHVRPDREGGATTYGNGRAVCVRGNLVRELPGWTVEVVDDGLGDTPHTVRTTTPTGHTYISRAGP